MSEPATENQGDQPDEQGLGSALEQREWDKPWKGTFLEAFATTGNVSQACRFARISRTAAYNEAKADPDFARVWTEAEEVAADVLEAIAVRRARGEPRRLVRTTTKTEPGAGERGPVVVETVSVVEETTVHSNAVLLRLLEARRPSRWSRRLDHRHSGGEGPPIGVQHSIPRTRTRDRLLELVELARELGVGPEHPDVNGRPRAAGELGPAAPG